MTRTLLMDWRDAVRESNLPSTARLVAYTLSTYMRGDGACFPSKETIADGCGLASRRPVDRAIDQLEAAGFLSVSRSRGRSSNRYQALLTAHEERGSDGGNRASRDSQPRTSDTATAYELPGKARNAYECPAPDRTDSEPDAPDWELNVASARRLKAHLEMAAGSNRLERSPTGAMGTSPKA
ncbi:MAG: helix-turn-helix domain-containing protein [Gaiella sp.]